MRLAVAGQELVEAQAALAEAIATASSVATSSTTPETTTTTTIVPPSHVERVQQAEEDLARTGEGITDETPLVEATAEYNSAAFALQIAWMRLLADAGCLSDEQLAEAVELVTAYTITLQTELQQVGLYDGAIDGIYGPETVAAVKQLQADSDLPETGFVDRATAMALDALLAELGLQTTAAEMTHTASVQTVLTLTGYWTGPIDGVWTDELTAALQAFQTALGVEPTGEVDAATLAAFEQALANRGSTPDTTVPPTALRRPPPATAPATTTPAPEPGGEATVAVADTELGQVITAANGMTVYLFAPDEQGAPTCIDACAETWEPLTVEDAGQVTGGDGVDASLLGTVDHPAGTQVTYNGWPLYFFAGDTAPATPTVRARAACGSCSTRPATRSATTDGDQSPAAVLSRSRSPEPGDLGRRQHPAFARNSVVMDTLWPRVGRGLGLGSSDLPAGDADVRSDPDAGVAPVVPAPSPTHRLCPWRPGRRSPARVPVVASITVAVSDDASGRPG